MLSGGYDAYKKSKRRIRHRGKGISRGGRRIKLKTIKRRRRLFKH